MNPWTYAITRCMIGGLIAIPCFSIAVVSLLKTYYAQVDPSNVFVRPLYNVVVALINALANHIPFFEVLWNIAPLLNSDQLLTWANLPFVLLCMGGGVGTSLIRRGIAVIHQMRAAQHQGGRVYFIPARQSLFEAIVAGIVATVVGGIILYLMGMN